MGGRSEPGSTVERRTVIVTVARLGLARMHTHTDTQPAGFAPRLGVQCALGLYRGLERIDRRAETGQTAVSRRLHDVASVRLDRRPQDCVVAAQRCPHGFWVLLPQEGRAFEIGEEEGHRPPRLVFHAHPLALRLKT